MTWRIRPATPSDVLYIDHLMHRFSSEVGFLPRTAMLEHLELVTTPSWRSRGPPQPTPSQPEASGSPSASCSTRWTRNCGGKGGACGYSKPQP